MRWLFVLDGTERSERAAAFALPMILPGQDEALLLAVGEDQTKTQLEAAVDRVRPLFAGIDVREQVVLTGLAETVAQRAETEQADMVVYGSRGRRGWSRMLLGSVAAYLERHLRCSLLVVRGELRPIRNILVASSLYAEQMRAFELGNLAAQRTGAGVTVLHVMSQLALSEKASELPLTATAEEAIDQHTREGELLTQRLEYFRAGGVQARPLLRHGLVLDELVAEMRTGKYELLIIGGHRLPADLPFGRLLAEDMADEILMNTQSPVLIA